MADVLTSDLEAHASGNVPADDVVPEIVEAKRSQAVEIGQASPGSDLHPRLPDGRQVSGEAVARKSGC